MADAKKFAGHYNLVKSENFDEYMKALNVGFALRTLGNTLKPSFEIAVNGDEWTLRTISTFKNTELVFKLNEEKEEETIDGRKVKSTLSFDNGKLVQRQVAQKSDEKNSEIVRELVGDDELVVTMTTNGDKGPVIAKRFYKRE